MGQLCPTRADGVHRLLSGTLMFGGTTTTLLSLPEATIDSLAIDWGAWDNPIAENWVAVNQTSANITRLSTDDYFAELTPTPIANLQGTSSYGSTIASSYIGSGNAGKLTDFLAAMDIDFDSGMISNGALMIDVGGNQVWSLGFAGSVHEGVVDLDMTSGQLSNFGNVLSNSINANLGGGGYRQQCGSVCRRLRFSGSDQFN